MKNNIKLITMLLGCLVSSKLSADVLVSQERIKDADLIVNTKQWKLSGANFTKYGMCSTRITITNTGSEKVIYQCGSDALNVDTVFSRLRYREVLRGLASYGIIVLLPMVPYTTKYVFGAYKRLMATAAGTEVTWKHCTDMLWQVYKEEKYTRYHFMYDTAAIGAVLVYWWHIRDLNNKLRVALNEIIVQDTVTLEPGQTITKIVVIAENDRLLQK